MSLQRKIFAFALTVFAFYCINAQGLLQKAKSGNVRSMYELANQYYNGIGMLQSYKDAFIWYKQAADKGNVESMYRTAMMYDKGLGVSENKTNAFNYYLTAAERGHEKSQLQVAKMFDCGEGTHKSEARAMIWYRLCAERNETYAQRRLGDMYLEGNPVEQNLVEAAYWYEKAVAQNDTPSMACLGYILSCNRSVRPDYERALQLIQAPLEIGDPMAQFVYAEMLDKGNGVETDKQKAMEYYNLAGSQGLSLAKEMTAIYKYRKNQDISGFLDNDVKNFTRAETWLILGKEYEYGLHVDKDIKEAERCYRKAAELGNVEAINNLSVMEAIRMNKNKR